ncbi:MAG: DUF1521 domain-containing protein [Candidatus Eremiobacteraeota bacterium]|nr:DUF1521 domain-containing protein [Candidatus Eremiobacteraeota bacterium]
MAQITTQPLTTVNGQYGGTTQYGGYKAVSTDGTDTSKGGVIKRVNPNGGTLNAAGNVAQNENGARGSGAANVNNQYVSGKGAAGFTYDKASGSLDAKGAASWTNKTTGESHTGSFDADLTRGQGGTVNVTKDGMSKTYKVPPRPAFQQNSGDTSTDSTSYPVNTSTSTVINDNDIYNINIYGDNNNVTINDGGDSVSIDNNAATTYTDENGNDVTVTPDNYHVSVDENNVSTTTTPGGYQIVYNPESGEATMTDPATGESSMIWGDPHVTESDGGQWEWDSATSTYVLPDGTKVTMNSTGGTEENGYGTLESMDIYSGTGDTHVSASAEGTAVTHDGQTADQAQADGDLYMGSDDLTDWYSVADQEMAA